MLHYFIQRRSKCLFIYLFFFAMATNVKNQRKEKIQMNLDSTQKVLNNAKLFLKRTDFIFCLQITIARMN